MQETVFSFSTSRLDLEFGAAWDRLRLMRLAYGGLMWATAGGLFAAEIDGQRYDAGNLALRGVQIDVADGFRHGIARFAGSGFEVEHHLQVYDDAALIEQWQVIRASGDNALKITRLDSLALEIARGDLLAFTSDWGQEFQPTRTALTGQPMILETRTGRSSKGMHPFFALSKPGGVLMGAAAWSGNWIFRFEPRERERYRLSGGLNDWEFSKTLKPGESVESAHVMLAFGADLDEAGQQYARVGRKYWYPRERSLAVEWNHWWSYEDAEIDETVVAANVEAAAALGVEACTLDAGWFGDSDAHWYKQRGKWEVVNAQRFPHGIRPLADLTHREGMRFGLWCEIEALGEQLAENPLAARRDGLPLGYVCFGNPDAQEWAYQTLSRLIQDYACDWIKLDFNLDPGAGCNRVDHGHGAGDGLYEHVQGYYRVLDRLRRDFPDVLLENCSSGGLRIDLGMLRHTDMTFLSDPDWPVHNLQVFWGASLTLAADACLHWSFSEWRPSSAPPPQTFNPRDPRLQPHQLDTYTRTAMLGWFGLSQKLPDLPEWVARRLADHVRIYKEHVRRFVRSADLFRLTDQPRRDGQGERWCAFQYALADEHLLFVFRLPGAEAARAIRLRGLQADRLYRVEDFDGGQHAPISGREAMDRGLVFDDLREEESALLRIY